MTELASAAPYGARFFNELRRLTDSTWGLDYADIPRVCAMDRQGILALLSRLHEPDWILQLESSSPEEFAQAIVREGEARAAERHGAELNPLDALFDLAQFLSG